MGHTDVRYPAQAASGSAPRPRRSFGGTGTPQASSALSSRPDEKVRERLKMARSRSGQDQYGNSFRSVLWLILSMMPQPVSSDPLSDEPQRDREEREGDSSTLTTPASAPRDGDASQGLRAAAQGQQQQDVHNNNSFSLSSSGRTTPAEVVINTPAPPLPAPTGAPAKSTQVGGRTEGGQQNQQELVRRKARKMPHQQRLRSGTPQKSSGWR